MPNFPRYKSTAGISDQPSSAQASLSTEGDVAMANANKFGKSSGELMGAVSDLSGKLMGVFDRAQRNTAELNFQTGLLDIKQRAENDPDYNNSAEYFKEIRKLHDDNLKGIGLPSTRGELSAKFGLQGRMAEIDIDNTFKKKGIDQGRAARLTMYDNLVANPQEGFEKTLEDDMAEQVESQLFGHVEGQKLVKDYIKQGKSNMFRIDLSVDPELAKKNLKKNKYGFDIQEQEKAEKLYDNEIKQREEGQKKLQVSTASDFGMQLVNKQLTPEKIKAAVADGAMDADMGLNYELAMSGPEKWSEFASATEQGEKAKLFIELLDKAADDDMDTRLKIIKSALENKNNKNLNNDDLTFILRAAAGKSTDPENKIWGFLRAALKSSPSAVKNSAELMEKFKTRWDMKEDPRAVMQEAAIDQFKEDRPETASYKIGDVIKKNVRQLYRAWV